MLLTGLELIDEEGLTLLGAPIMEQAVGGILRRKLQDLQLMVGRLDQGDRHDAVSLLRHCFAIPKLIYTLRCVLCYQLVEVLLDYDEQLRVG